jgi:hypothetical protein
MTDRPSCGLPPGDSMKLELGHFGQVDFSCQVFDSQTPKSPSISALLSFQVQDFVINIHASDMGSSPAWLQITDHSELLKFPHYTIRVHSFHKSKEAVDFNIYAPRDRGLWEKARIIAEGLLENAAFLSFISQKLGDGSTYLKEFLGDLKDGAYAPRVSNGLFSIYQIAHEVMPQSPDGLLGRGYMITGAFIMSIFSISPYGSSEPEIYISFYNSYVHPNPKTGNTEFMTYLGNLDEISKQNTIKEVLEAIHNNLEYIQAQVPGYREFGILTESDDLDILIRAYLKNVNPDRIELKDLPPPSCGLGRAPSQTK